MYQFTHICALFIFSIHYIQWGDGTPEPIERSKIAILLEKLGVASDEASKSLQNILRTWEVNSFPNFLLSSALSPLAWELMKLKLQTKIIDAAVTGTKQNWTTSFMGSSVTAGRDSAVEASFVSLTEKWMGPAFTAVDVIPKSNQNAHEANPCIPYNICVHAYAGPDADLIH
jgi:hypothetical protein